MRTTALDEKITGGLAPKLRGSVVLPSDDAYDSARRVGEQGMVDWRINGEEIAICSCSWGCPCQFNAPPTNGYCHAGLAAHIDRGRFGSISIDGLNFVTLYRWPGPVHKGDGEPQPFVDERATPEQRTAILTILSGRESVPGANAFSVYSYTLQSNAVTVDLQPSPAQRPVERRQITTQGGSGAAMVRLRPEQCRQAFAAMGLAVAARYARSANGHTADHKPLQRADRRGRQ